ncbi:MAG: DUF5995 family protein [Bacteroidota bacterium]
MAEFQPAKTIDEVVERLQVMYDELREAGSAYGFFPALYLLVTEAIRAGVRNERFEDNPRMEKLDVIFANRYFEAWHIFQEGGTPAPAWALNFERCGRPNKYLIIQMLLLGINAHVNVDLGIAAAEVAPGKAYASLENDFNTINDVLGALIDDVKKDMGRFSPRIGWVLRWLGGREEKLLSFSLVKARDQAWKFGADLAQAKREDWPGIIDKKNERIVKLGKAVAYPSIFGKLLMVFVKWSETKEFGPVLEAIRTDYSVDV